MQEKKRATSGAALSPLRRRNRLALLDAAQAMLDEGLTPTLAEVADRAEISRATAYRYFSSAEQLLNEAALDTVAKAIPDRIARIPRDGVEHAETAIRDLVAGVEEMVRENEPAFRTMLRLSLEAGEGSRGGRRIGWIDACLTGANIPEPARARLTGALALLCGIEARIVLKDVCGLDDKDARETLLFAAEALVAAARGSPDDGRAS